MLSTRPFLFSLLIAVSALQSSALPDAASNVLQERHGVGKGQMQAAISTIRAHYGKDYNKQIVTFCNNLLQPNTTLPARDNGNTSSPTNDTQRDAGTGTSDTNGSTSTGTNGQSGSGTGSSDDGQTPAGPPSTISGDQSNVSNPGDGADQGRSPFDAPHLAQVLSKGTQNGRGDLFERSPRSDRSHSRSDRKVKVKTQPSKGRKSGSSRGHRKVTPPGHAVAKAGVGGAFVAGAASSATLAIADVGGSPSTESPSNASTTTPGTATAPSIGVSSGSETPATGDDSANQVTNTTTPIDNGPNGPTNSAPGTTINNQTLPEFKLPAFLRHFDERILKEACQIVTNSSLLSWLPTPSTNRPSPPWWSQVVGDQTPTPISSFTNGTNSTWPLGKPWSLPTVTVTVTETVTVTATPVASATP